MLKRPHRSKNSGGRIAPTASAGLIEALPCSVNGLAAGWFGTAPVGRDKLLTRLNFADSPGIPGGPAQARADR